MAQHKLRTAKGNCGISSRERWAELPCAPGLRGRQSPSRAPERRAEPPHAWVLSAQGGSSSEKRWKKGLCLESLLNMHNALCSTPSTIRCGGTPYILALRGRGRGHKFKVIL